MSYDIADTILDIIADNDNAFTSEHLAYFKFGTNDQIRLGIEVIINNIPEMVDYHFEADGTYVIKAANEYRGEIRDIIRRGGLEKYIKLRDESRKRVLDKERLEEESMRSSIEYAKKSLKIAEEANRKSNSANVIAFIAALAAIVSGIFTCNK